MGTTSTTSTKDPKTAYRAMNDYLQLANQALMETKKEFMQNQREKEQKRRNGIIARMIQMMRNKGASDRSIQRASRGIDEFAKFAIRKDVIPTSDQPDQPQPDAGLDLLDPVEEMLGVLLSEVETQEVRWLWEKRLPLGKITVLDGDPGMGKSMLAIAIAACVSIGHPMPDGTPGKQGGVILIAPEDGAGDTLKPRLEAAGGDASHVLLLNTVLSLDGKKRQVVDRPFSLSHATWRYLKRRLSAQALSWSSWTLLQQSWDIT